MPRRHIRFSTTLMICAAMLGPLLAPVVARAENETLELTPAQVQNFTVGQVADRFFPQFQTLLGSIDFNQDQETQVFPNYQGKLLQLFAHTGDMVHKGDVIFTVDSPDLINAESTFLAADGVMALTTAALARAKDLLRHKGIAEKDYQQAVSDQQTAAGNLLAAHDALRLFGKTQAEINTLLRTRRADPALEVRSPVNGIVVARNGAPGMFVQPGTAPAPFTVADNATMWLLANAPESLSPVLANGQQVSAIVAAFPGQVFTGIIAAITPIIDPATRRFTVRADVADPNHVLRAGMFANFTITTGAPIRAPAIPVNGIVREGDGTMSVWVTRDRQHFTRRTVTVGLTSDGFRQIISGVRSGELVVTDGAVFLSNMLTADPT